MAVGAEHSSSEGWRTSEPCGRWIRLCMRMPVHDNSASDKFREDEQLGVGCLRCIGSHPIVTGGGATKVQWTADADVMEVGF